MKFATLVIGIFIISAGVWGQKPPLLGEKDVAAIAGEISGETAKRNLEGIARFHRQRGSKGFHEAAELVAERLRAYGLSDVAVLQFPADGATMYGTQRSRPAWEAEFAELRELRTEIFTCDEVSGKSKQQVEQEEKERAARGIGQACDTIGESERVLESYEAQPVVLAEDSESADVKAELVDVGEGTKESDYAGKKMKGKIVLVSAQPGAVQDLAVGRFGAVGIVSYAQNQKTAWSGENQDAIRWGHLETFSVNKTFAFMVSLRRANAMKEVLAKGGEIRLHAVVKAGQHPGNYEVVTATIPGADAKLKEEEIAFSCHLDHQRPGANDNASGCATILEVARTLQKLIAEGKLARPARTIRFIFPPEIEGTMALLTGHGYYGITHTFTAPNGQKMASTMDGEVIGSEVAKRIKAVIHMDMVGGGPETKAVFHVTRGPMSLPSFVQDVAWAFAEWVNEESYEFAATGKAEYPMVSAEGGKEPLRAEYSAYTMGSDHDVYQDSSFGIPAIYLNDWPDRFIHTNLDSTANIDATKLKRAGFIGAASGYFLANLNSTGGVELALAQIHGRSVRLLSFDGRVRQIPREEAETLRRIEAEYDGGVSISVHQFSPPPGGLQVPYDRRLNSSNRPKATGDGLVTYSRRNEPRGPMAVFGYDYFAVEWAKRGHATTPKLLEYEGLWGSGEDYAYEVLNFADGKRNAQEIRDAVSAEYGPVPLELVVEYLKALEEVGVVEKVK
ncbi:MAG TPA: M28 family peptidase [Candidatus Acidoferrum sp.]|nr:M28 family peptidase [Candidatus Acidoferrum sp.]